MNLRVLPMGAFIACTMAAPIATLVVEPNSPVVLKGRLAEPIGIETMGGVFTPLLQADCAIPCEATTIFTTAADNQAEISVFLFRGPATLASENHALGEFVVVGIPPAPRGEPQVALTFRAEPAGIVLSARELSGASVQLQRGPR